MPVLNTGLATPARGFTIPYSCRFDVARDSNLTKTWGGAPTLGTKYTVSCWVKVCQAPNTRQAIYSTAGGDENEDIVVIYQTGGVITLRLTWENSAGSPAKKSRRSYQVFRDPSAWYHMVFAWDSTQGTAADRLKVYINNELVTPWRADISEGEDPDENEVWRWNADGETCSVGYGNVATSEFDGYIAEFHNIDGTALTPSSFGETGDYGEWKPKKVEGLTYGDNGFYLDFADAADLGDDESGEGNDFAENNIVATDQMLDSPTNNFATMNPLDRSIDNSTLLSEGNLKCVQDYVSDARTVRATMGNSTGKWYFECLIVAGGDGVWSHGDIGILNVADDIDRNNVHLYDTGWWHENQGQTYNGASAENTSLSAVGGGDIVQVAYDLDASKIWFGRNNTWILSGDPAAGSNETYDNLSGTLAPACDMMESNSNGTLIFNFGQDSSFAAQKTAQGNQDGNSIGDFYYTPPTDFLALCTSNLPAVAVTPSEYFNTILYDDGAGAKTGVGFQPDLVWLKSRGSAYESELTDAVRGVTKAISSNTTAAESTDSTGLTAFGADGFTVGADTNYADTTGDGMAAWNWKAGTAVSGTTTGAGDDTDYTGSINTDAGFSIIRYGGNDSAGHQIPHRLGVVPDAIFIKNLTVASWNCFFPNTSFGGTKGLQLDNTGGAGTVAWINNTMPTTTVVELSAGAATNASNSLTPPQPYIMYCWKSIDGYSKIGEYKGNGSANGTFVYTGFRPAFVLIKVHTTSEPWSIRDSVRSPENLANEVLKPDNNAAELTTGFNVDLLSNGFKCKTGGAEINDSSHSYIYIAFAETPFKYSNAR